MKLLTTILVCLLFTFNIYSQWQPSNGPEGGTITGFMEKGNYIFTTEGDYHSGAVYRSSDNGGSWEFVSEGLPIESSITSPVSNQSYIFIGTKSLGVFRSSDLGLTWEQVSNGIPINYATITALNSVNDTIFAGTSFYGMYKSTDNGENWVEINNGLTGNSKYIRVEYTFNNILFIGTNGGLYRSSDYGSSWQFSGSGIPINKFPIMDIYSQDNYLFAVALNTFYRSSDNGSSWQSISGVPNPNSVYSFSGNLYAGSYLGLYRSTDYGNSWSLLNNGMPQFPNVTEIFGNNSSLLVSVPDFGIYGSSDSGNQWFSSNVGIQNKTPLCLLENDGYLFSGTSDADFGLIWQYDFNNNKWIQKNNGAPIIGYNTFFGNAQYLFAGTDGDGIYRTTDNGDNWEQIGLQFANSYIDVIQGDDNYTFMGLAAFQIDVYRSTDNGNTWEATSVPGSGDITSIYKYDNYLFTGRTSGVYRTSDEGDSWATVNNGLQSIPFVSAFTDAGNYIFVVCNDGIYRSSDDGDNWTKLNSFPNYQVYSITHNGNNIFVGTRYNGLFFSTDLGANWNEYSTGLPILSYGDFPSIYSLQVFNNNIFAGLEGLGVWFSSLSFVPVELTSFTANVSGNNVELKWQTETEKNNKEFKIQRKENVNLQGDWKGIGFVNGNGTTTQQHIFSFVDKNLSAGDFQYRLKQIDYDGSFEYSNIVEVKVSSPDKFTLEQNYPNPFNPSTTIAFTVPREVQVNLSVFNTLGEKVKELKNEVMKPGYYEVKFDAAILASGIYFYRIIAGDFSQTKKMIDLR